jgi:hypothetical protein
MKVFIGVVFGYLMMVSEQASQSIQLKKQSTNHKHGQKKFL